MSTFDYDLIVIGGGSGGLTAASLSAGLGKKTLLVNKGKLGGECTWAGCVPSKALLKSAHVSHTIGNFKDYGLKLTGAKVNAHAVLQSVRKIQEGVYKNEEPEIFEKLGIKVLENTEASFIDKHTIKAGSKKITGSKIVIATGSSPMVPPIEGLSDTTYYTNETIFSLKKLPADMVVMGGGPIGVEMAFAFNRLGVKVTIVEMFPKILFREDEEMSEFLTERLKSEGINIITGAKIVKVEGKSKKKITYEIDSKNKSISGELLLVAAGRVPNINDLNLDKAGVNHSRRGIITNKRLQTSSSNIFACGDVVGPYQFSHMAGYQAIVAVWNAFIIFKQRVNYDNVPWITFTEPELARSGITEKEARDRYKKSIRVFKLSYEHVDRAVTDRATAGIAKVICKKNGKILGVHIAGERAGELMHEVHLAKSLGIPFYKLNSVIHAYPSYSDLIKKMAKEAYVTYIQDKLIIKILKFFRRKK